MRLLRYIFVDNMGYAVHDDQEIPRDACKIRAGSAEEKLLQIVCKARQGRIGEKSVTSESRD